MSGAITATQVLAAAAVAGTAYSIYSGEKTANRQSQAAEEARTVATQQADQADQAMNAANKRRPNLGAAVRSGAAPVAGAGGTMLTGPAGVDPGMLTLGKNTLLGS